MIPGLTHTEDAHSEIPGKFWEKSMSFSTENTVLTESLGCGDVPFQHALKLRFRDLSGPERRAWALYVVCQSQRI